MNKKSVINLLVSLAVGLGIAFSSAVWAKNPEMAVKKRDSNGDGKVSLDEWDKKEFIFNKIDLDGDGYLTAKEFAIKWGVPMPDASDSNEKSIDVKATLIFLAGGKHCRTNVSSWEFERMDNITVMIPPCDEVDNIDLDEIKTPIFVAGISTGSIKSIKYYNRHPDRVSGIILLSGIASRKCKWCGSLYDTDYRNVNVPVLFVNHKHDKCPSTKDMYITKGFKNSLPSEDTTITMITGGYDQGGSSLASQCFKNTHHSFSGNEPDVTDVMNNWIMKRVD
jgi:hypothetical protein